MKKLNSLVILFGYLSLVYGCATNFEIKQAENEPLCWGNINAKSAKYELGTNQNDPEWGRKGFKIYGQNSPLMSLKEPENNFSDYAGIITVAWNLTSKILHAIVATVNTNCYSDISSTNSNKEQSNSVKSIPRKNNSDIDISVLPHDTTQISTTKKHIDHMLNWQPSQADKN